MFTRINKGDYTYDYYHPKEENLDSIVEQISNPTNQPTFNQQVMQQPISNQVTNQPQVQQQIPKETPQVVEQDLSFATVSQPILNQSVTNNNQQ